MTRQVCGACMSPWNPTLLEICVMGAPGSESPETWAASVHQQRLPDESFEGLALPLLLHLARKAGDYTLQHQDDKALVSTDDTDAEPTIDPDSDE